MKPKPNFNEWVALIDNQLKEYYQKQKEESRKRFEQYYK